MKYASRSAFTPVDWLYAVVVLTSCALSSVAACSVLLEQEVLGALMESDIVVVYNEVGRGLAPLALCILIWRVVFACRYRAYAPLDDRKLPVVTVIIPAYNEGRQVLSTVRSVMASDYPAQKLHVLCVDDGSRDDTWQWMEAAAKEFPSIRLIRQPRNMGKRHALLAGFRQAKSGVFVTLDSDSEVLPHTLRDLVSPFAHSPHVGAVAGNVRVLNLDKGLIPKLLDVSFTMSFDFLRRAQSVYGGVLCTPGALSAYRAAAILPVIDAWAAQTFLGHAANIGEDRALTNVVLRRGFRVVYQKEAIVLTKVPENYHSLSRMLLRWARSNVRECLVMSQFLYTNFRRRDGGGMWLRLDGSLELLLLPLIEAAKIGLLVNILAHPVIIVRLLTLGCVISAIVPAIVYQFRRPCLAGYLGALGYAVYWTACLSWISFWGLLSAGRSGWLTRGLTSAAKPLSLELTKQPSQAA
ncbi:MAG: glycosyltransferase family 2 protein [Desulfovibrionaceae bacterium]